MFYCIKILAQCQSFFLYVKHNMSYTNIDTTPILTCTFMYIKDEHQIFELSESMKWIYKKAWRRFSLQNDLISLQNNLRLNYRVLFEAFLQISDMLAFKQSGGKLNCTFINMIKLIKIVCILLGVEVFICWIKFKRH